jgi:hypothetical protein
MGFEKKISSAEKFRNQIKFGTTAQQEDNIRGLQLISEPFLSRID